MCWSLNGVGICCFFNLMQKLGDLRHQPKPRRLIPLKGCRRAHCVAGVVCALLLRDCGGRRGFLEEIAGPKTL